MNSERLRALTSWHSDWKNLRVLVVGLGETGFAVVDTLCELGCEVAVVAEGAPADYLNLAEVVGARTVVTKNVSDRVAVVSAQDWDVAVVSPGVTTADPVVHALSDRGIPLWSDLELASRLRDKGDVVAEWVIVQEYPGATTTAEVAARIFEAAEHPARVVGFGAPPILDALRDPHPYLSLIILVSESSTTWWARYPDTHRRPAMTVSLASEPTQESGVFYDATEGACVYLRGMGSTEAQVQDAEVVEGARAIGIGLDSPGMSDLGVVEGIIVDRAFLDDRAHQALEISTVEELSEAGWTIPEQLPAVMAAVAIARARDISPALIAGVLSLP